MTLGSHCLQGGCADICMQSFVWHLWELILGGIFGSVNRQCGSMGGGDLSVDGCVCVCVRGRHWFSLAQFRDNVLIASSLGPGTHSTVVQDISSLLSHIWQLEVLCDCVIEETPICSGACLSSEVRALGFTLVVGGGSGMAAVHPFALKQDWSLRYGPPLKSPKASERTYVSCIFSGVLTAGLPWCVKWGSLDLECLGLGAAGPAMRVPPTHGITGDAQIGAPCILCLPLVFRKYYARSHCGKPPHASTETPRGSKTGPLAACPRRPGYAGYTQTRKSHPKSSLKHTQPPSPLILPCCYSSPSP